MFRLRTMCGVFAMLMTVMLLTGCGPTTPDPPATPDPAVTDNPAPTDDQAAAAKQKICPVSGEPLDAMGEPLKVDVNGRTVFICCESCRSKLLADPEKYLAKLPPAE